jgi:hypothetical protein
MPGRTVLVAFAVTLLLADPAAAQWQTIVPGGDTLCSDGSPYRFFVHPGDPGKLLVEFEGGGGCWDDVTCATDIYSRRIQVDPAQAEREGRLQGIYDRSNPENPFRDWTHVYVPYCTGDLHWGNRSRTYLGLRGPYTVHHRGAVNASAALSWASQNVPAPSQLFVAGCSAGGYGSILWSAHLMARYPGASAAQLSDSAAGVVPPGFFATPLANWGAAAAWPSFIPALDLAQADLARLSLPDLYSGVAHHYPLSAFSQFNRLEDLTQMFFFLATGGNPADWTSRMRSSVAEVQAANPNFFGYTASGTQHCVINSADFYTTQVGGERLVDWVRTLATTYDPGQVP